MATFEAQVESLTGLDIESSGTYPTQGQLSQYLKDGVIDVTNRNLALNPASAQSFQRTTSSDSQGVSVGGATIISVMREAGADGSSDGSTAWRSCRIVPPSLQSLVVDTDSLHYASQYNPAYIIDNNNSINVYPTPSANNGIKVYYVNEEPRDITNDAALIYSHENIKYFPNDKVHLVVLYAGAKSLLNALSSKVHSLPSLALPPIPIAPTLTDNSITFTTTAPSYNPPAVSPNFTDADKWINTEEDSEMSKARAEIITTQLQDFQQRMTNELNVFNKENAEYQAQLQKAIQDATLASTDDGQKLQKYQTELQSYQGEVSKEVQRIQTEITVLNSDFQWLQARHAILKQEYDTAFALLNPQAMQQRGER